MEGIGSVSPRFHTSLRRNSHADQESTTSAPEASAEPLKIGHIFTANPAVGAIGQYYDGFRTYFDELNANGGIDGQMVEIEAIVPLP